MQASTTGSKPQTNAAALHHIQRGVAENLTFLTGTIGLVASGMPEEGYGSTIRSDPYVRARHSELAIACLASPSFDLAGPRSAIRKP